MTIKVPKNHKISGVAPKPINVITEGFCKRYTEEPRYNGEMWAEFVGRSTAKCTKSYIWCYFDTHTSEGHIKLKAFLRRTAEPNWTKANHLKCSPLFIFYPRKPVFGIILNRD